MSCFRLVFLFGWLLLLNHANCQLKNDHRGIDMIAGKDPTWTRLLSYAKNQMEEKGIVTNIGSALHNLLVALKSTSYPTAVGKNVSQQCKEDSQLYVHSLYQNLSGWAIQMQESSGHMPPGLFGSYNIHADGMFDECKNVQAPGFRGQYCTAAFYLVPVEPSELLVATEEEMNERARNPLAIFHLLGVLSGSDKVNPKLSNAEPWIFTNPSISFCLPSSCSAQDLGQAIAEIVGGYVVDNSSLVTMTDDQYCFKNTDGPPSFDGVDITVIVVFSLVGLLVLMATIHEGWQMYHDDRFEATDSFLVKGLHCFSALNNGRKLLSMKVSTSSGDNFGCIHGIRFFSTCWVVLGHFWSIYVYTFLNPIVLYQAAFGWKMQTILNSYVSVDTFLIMSGLLVSYLLLRELDRNKGRFNIGMFYLHRYLRLTVVYAFVLAFVASLLVYIGTGPNWYSRTLYSNACRDVWWRQFLYINNLYPLIANTQCMGQSWYLALDMQLYIVSPLLIYPLWRWRRFGQAWMAFVMLTVHAVIYTLYIIYDFQPTFIITRSADLAANPKYTDLIYQKPWTRAPPYLVGIWIGWYLHATKNSQQRISKAVVAVGWTLSTVVSLAILYGLTPYLDETKVPDIKPIVQYTYGPLHRTAWAMAIGWIIFACSRGYGGIVNRFLSWKGFLPLGRLTYCVYLVHFDMIISIASANRKLGYYTFFGEFTMYLGVVFISFALAFILSVTIEASFMNLEKLVFSSRGNKDQSKT